MQKAAANRIALIVLENRRVGLLLVADDDVEDRMTAVRSGQRVAQIRLGHNERACIGGASVDDPGHEPLPAQAPIGSATALRSFLNLELYSLSCHGAEV